MRMIPRAFGLVAVLTGAACHDFDKIPAGIPTDAAPAPDLALDMGPPEMLPSSCRGRQLTCGMEGDSCCATATIPGGTFSRGYDTSMRPMQGDAKVLGWQDKDASRSFISAFRLDKYEVTVGRFRPFYNVYESWLQNRPFDHDGAHPRIPTSGWNRLWTMDGTKYPLTKDDLQQRIDACNGTRLSNPESRIVGWLDDPAGAHDRMPMTCLGFYDALLFCIWDEGRLPTEAEWNFAATGGDAQNAYPWGTPPATAFTVEPDRGNIGPITSTLALKEVGNYPRGAGVWGQLDLAGNAYEWVHDTCENDCSAYNPDMVTEPLELAGNSRVLRGGSYVFSAVEARAVYRKRVGNGVTVRYEDVGLRCARNVPQ